MCRNHEYYLDIKENQCGHFMGIHHSMSPGLVPASGQLVGHLVGSDGPRGDLYRNSWRRPN